ncbi:RNA-directed DNA polymerase, eukaryota, reverse transcriptase zinc-binding domain protein [Tanacetum coccineum]
MMDKDTLNKDIIKLECELLKKFNEAMMDEEKLVFQQAQIEWLSAGDKKNAYFHSMIRSKRNLNRIECTYDDQETRYTGDDIPLCLMVTDVTKKEIKEDMFDIGDNKAPRHDGKLLEEINATLITLIPKVANPTKVTEFRPISCCNVLYKCISKNFNNRMKFGLTKLVNVNQSAFIPGRLIQDNILITQELLRGYNRKNGQKRCAKKIDV